MWAYPYFFVPFFKEFSMILKLIKYSKLNIGVAIVMSMVLLFIVFPVATVKAETSVGVDYNNFVTFKSELARTGYMSYYDHTDYAYNKDFKVNKEVSISDLSGNVTLWSNDNYKVAPDWDSFNASSGTASYDIYCLFGGNYDTSYGSRVPLIWYFIVPSGSKICWGKDTQFSPSEDMWQQSVFNVVTDASALFCIRFYHLGDEMSAYSYGYGIKSGASVSGTNRRCFKSQAVTSGGNLRFTIRTDNQYQMEPQLAPFTFTNIATIPVKNDVDYAPLDKFIAGDSSLATNADSSWSDKKEYPAESFYWDSMTCKPSVVGVDSSINKNKYCFAFNYTYSCPLMTDPSELFSCSVVYSSDIRYQDGKGRMYSFTDSQRDSFSLNKHKNGYVNNSLYLQGNIGEMGFGDAMNLLVSSMLSFLPSMGAGTEEVAKYNQYTVKSAKIYVTVFLYHIPDPDRFFTDGNLGLPSIGGDEIPSDSKVITSTDVRSFSFDLFDLHEDTEGTQVKPTVTTEDVTDDDGNVTDKKVTDVVATDDSGKTVVNITIDNSNKVIDGNANVNTGGGSGSGDGDDEDKNSKSFWKYVSGIVALFTALLNSDSGLFAVIASYFKFIPKDFWSVTIGAIVVIAILSIYRLAKKGG